MFMKKDDFAEPFLIAIGIVLLTLVFYPCIEKWFWLSSDYEAATLTSALLMAIVTAIYVRYTYRIFDATTKNTEQTAKAQRIAYLERRLELFYLPLKNFLTLYQPEIYKNEVQTCINEAKDNDELQRFIKMKTDKFIEDYQKLIPFSYLATNETMNHLNEAVHIFNETRKVIDSNPRIRTQISAINEENIKKYDNIKSEIKKDIESLKNELENLVKA